MSLNSYQFTQLYHRLDQRWSLLFSNIGCGFTFIIVCNSIVRVTNSLSSNLYLIFNLKQKFVKYQIVLIVIFLLSLVPIWASLFMQYDSSIADKLLFYMLLTLWITKVHSLLELHARMNHVYLHIWLMVISAFELPNWIQSSDLILREHRTHLFIMWVWKIIFTLNKSSLDSSSIGLAQTQIWCNHLLWRWILPNSCGHWLAKDRSTSGSLGIHLCHDLGINFVNLRGNINLFWQ